MMKCAVGEEECAAGSGQWEVKASARNPDSSSLRFKTADAQPLTTDHRPLTSVLIIGHRGAAAVAPENTLRSFERALADGADGIEFDVRLASDGVPVVIHDPTLRRTALKRGKVSSFSSTELRQMDAGTWFNLRYPRKAKPEYTEATIPTLEDVFELLEKREALFYVEMKCGPKDRTALAAAVAKLIRAHSLASRVIVESFDLTAIAEIKRFDAGLRTAALFDRKLSRPVPSARKMIEQAIRCEAEEIALHHSLATRRTVEEATRFGLETVIWTADNPAWVERAIKRGVRAIITNNPARLCARRDELLKT
jgi:glycerophosphoryl diester phosphodiesterase